MKLAMNGPGMTCWYVAVLVLRARVGTGWQDDELLDHQVRLIRASSAEAAHASALAIGADQRQEYKNGDGELVNWEFVGLADLDEVQMADLAHGVEVYSWRSREQAADAVLPKEKLAAFWRAANADRGVTEILDDHDSAG